MADVTPFMRRSYQFFIDKGYSPQAAAAMSGNGQWESSGSSTIEDPRGEGSIGLYQWRLDRRTGLNDFARARGLDPRAEDTQLQFADWELNHTERGAGDQLRGAKDLDQANAAMMNYLRPSGWTSNNPQGGHAWSNRVALSRSLFDDGRGEAPAPSQFSSSSDVASTQPPTAVPTPTDAQPTPSAETPSIWDSLGRSGMKMMGTPDMVEAGPSPMPMPAQARRGQPVSLIDLIFASRKPRPAMRG